METLWQHGLLELFLEAERLTAIAKETSQIIRCAMVNQKVPYFINLVEMVSMDNSTLSAKLSLEDGHKRTSAGSFGL